MTERKVRLILCGILGGLGLIYLAVSVLMGVMAARIPSERVIVLASDLETLPVLHLGFGVLGALFLGAAVLIWLGMKRGERQREEIFRYGTVVEGVVEKVTCNAAVKVNQHNPWRVHVTCVHPATRETITVRSHSVFDLTVHPGDTVRVAFDPLNEKKYAVEMPERKGKA